MWTEIFWFLRFYPPFAPLKVNKIGNLFFVLIFNTRTLLLTCLFLRPRGYYFVSGSYDRTARLWCTENPQPLRIFSGHLSDVNVSRYGKSTECEPTLSMMFASVPQNVYCILRSCDSINFEINFKNKTSAIFRRVDFFLFLCLLYHAIFLLSAVRKKILSLFMLIKTIFYAIEESLLENQNSFFNIQ